MKAISQLEKGVSVSEEKSASVVRGKERQLCVVSEERRVKEMSG